MVLFRRDIYSAFDTEKELLELAGKYGFTVRDIERASFLPFLPDNLKTQYDLRLLEFTLEPAHYWDPVEWSGESESSSAY
jgi:hypothetical protein